MASSLLGGLTGELSLYYNITNNTGGPLVVEGVNIKYNHTQGVFISVDDLEALTAMGTLVTLSAGTPPSGVFSG